MQPEEVCLARQFLADVLCNCPRDFSFSVGLSQGLLFVSAAPGMAAAPAQRSAALPA